MILLFFNKDCTFFRDSSSCCCNSVMATSAFQLIWLRLHVTWKSKMSRHASTADRAINRNPYTHTPVSTHSTPAMSGHWQVCQQQVKNKIDSRFSRWEVAQRWELERLRQQPFQLSWRRMFHNLRNFQTDSVSLHPHQRGCNKRSKAFSLDWCSCSVPTSGRSPLSMWHWMMLKGETQFTPGQNQTHSCRKIPSEWSPDCANAQQKLEHTEFATCSVISEFTPQYSVITEPAAPPPPSAL